jgi:long-chain acyl-CoA synthetase
MTHFSAAFSLADLLARTVREHPERPALTYRTEQGWHTLSWHEFAAVVLDVIDHVDNRLPAARTVAILADTDPRYPLLELALGLSGRSVLPLYVTASDDEIATAVTTVAADAVIVGPTQSARHFLKRADLPRHYLLHELAPLPGVEGPVAVLPADVEPFDTEAVRSRLAELRRPAAAAPLLYLQSTGTTGPSRVVEVSHAAIISAVLAVRNEPTAPFPRFLSFLPTAHISERLLTLYTSLVLVGHTWYGGGMATLAQDLRTSRPTLFLVPPLVLDAIQNEVRAGACRSAIGRALLAATDKTAATALASGRTGLTRRSVRTRLFGRRVRRAAGLHHVVDAFSGTAPLSPAAQAWWEAIGMPVRNVYGQTEVAGATTMTRLRGDRYDGVGVPVAGVRVRIADNGELLVSSPSVISGYAGRQDGMPADGWLRTGDRATMTGDGEVLLRGRVQDVIPSPRGGTLDLREVAGAVRRLFGDVDVAAAGTASGTALYVAICPPAVPRTSLLEEGEVVAAAPDDPRSEALTTLLDEIDPDSAITSLALFDGVFGLRTGEVGPTGKLRSWRIHQLRSDTLHDRAVHQAPRLVRS